MQFCVYFHGKTCWKRLNFPIFSGRSLHSKIIFGLLNTHNSAYCFNKSCNKLWHSAKIREVNGQFANLAKATKAFFLKYCIAWYVNFQITFHSIHNLESIFWRKTFSLNAFKFSCKSALLLTECLFVLTGSITVTSVSYRHIITAEWGV